MIARAIRTNRLFSRRLTNLASHQVGPQPSAPAELRARRLCVLDHLMIHGEPARFELLDCSFIDEASNEVAASAHWRSGVNPLS